MPSRTPFSSRTGERAARRPQTASSVKLHPSMTGGPSADHLVCLAVVYIAYAGIESQFFGRQSAWQSLFDNRIEAVAVIESPHVFNTAIPYRSPAYGDNKVLRALTENWTYGAFLRYGSGFPISVPYADNNLNSVMLRNDTNVTFFNRVPGVPLFLKILTATASTRTHNLPSIPPPGQIRPPGLLVPARSPITTTASNAGHRNQWAWHACSANQKECLSKF